MKTQRSRSGSGWRIAEYAVGSSVASRSPDNRGRALFLRNPPADRGGPTAVYAFVRRYRVRHSSTTRRRSFASFSVSSERRRSASAATCSSTRVRWLSMRGDGGAVEQVGGVLHRPAQAVRVGRQVQRQVELGVGDLQCHPLHLDAGEGATQVLQVLELEHTLKKAGKVRRKHGARWGWR